MVALEANQGDISMSTERNVVAFRLFTPPALTPLLALRLRMGVKFEQAISVLHISKDTLLYEEALERPQLLSDLGFVFMRYLFFLSVHGDSNERNLVQDHLTLFSVRQNIFEMSYEQMGRTYGGFSAKDWYSFEIHERILPRNILRRIESDVYKHSIQK